MNLNPCYFLDDEGKSAWNYLCVLCSETLVSFEWVASKYPLPGTEVAVKWKGPKSVPVRMGNRTEIYQIPKNAYATVRYADICYVLNSEGTGKKITFKAETDSEPGSADNVFAAWSMIKRRIREPSLAIQPEMTSRYEAAANRIKRRR